MSTRRPAEWQAQHAPVIAECCATGGTAAGRFAGRPLLLPTAIGARSGRPMSPR